MVPPAGVDQLAEQFREALQDRAAQRQRPGTGAVDLYQQGAREYRTGPRIAR